MSDHFICSICGIQHDGLITDRAYKLPDDVWSIPEAERSEKARFDSDLCQFGERFFMRCILLVPFTNHPGAFGWGVWAEVDWPTFKRYLELYKVDGSSEPAHGGLLANEIPGYPRTLGSEIEVNFGNASERPTIRLTPEDDSQLAEEQRRGMNHARHHEILDLIEAAN
ncbi:DUF2199 domain-containing protein [Rhizobium leguminosarum]|nr:DUF2199 domain-containing protein [Rhizobium leguminosarum]